MIEELKMILETLDDLGESAFTFAMWYLGLQVIESLLLTVVASSVIYMLYRLGMLGIQVASHMESLRMQLGLSKRIYLSDLLSDINKEIQRLKDNQKDT